MSAPASQIHALAGGLAAAMLAGVWRPAALAERTAHAMGRKWRWRHATIRRLLAEFPVAPTYDRLRTAIGRDAGFCRAMGRLDHPRLVHWYSADLQMQPRFPEWQLPQLATTGNVADWLGLEPGRMAWLADCQGRQQRRQDLGRGHYHYHWLRKPTGDWRLVEAPKAQLKGVQRQLLDGLLAQIPTHPAACGFRRGQSIFDFVAPHIGQAVVLHLDLRDFFPSVAASRVHALFTTLGYPTGVARVLTGLVCSAAPFTICRQHPGGERYTNLHLPQGAPSSPALSNLCAFRLDVRLAAAAERCGAVYSRYADDLAFSGATDFQRRAENFLPLVWRIVRECGFDVHHRKTRVMSQAVRQRLTGLVLNSHCNVPRRQYDRLKAILSNCRRLGPASQNRGQHPDFAAHLRGRIAFVEQANPSRGAKLRAIFADIAW